MKYFVIDNRTGKITCFTGGYTTLKGAKDGRMSPSWPLCRDAIEYARKSRIPAGDKFYKAVLCFVEENSEIIEVNEVIYKTADGRCIQTCL